MADYNLAATDDWFEGGCRARRAVQYGLSRSGHLEGVVSSRQVPNKVVPVEYANSVLHRRVPVVEARQGTRTAKGLSQCS